MLGCFTRFLAPRACGHVPTGVNIAYFTPPRGMPLEQDLRFLGAMDWRRNIDGLHWFATQVLPLKAPACRNVSEVVGRHPGSEVRELARCDQRMHVTGTVADVRPYLWKSAVSIVPLRIGGRVPEGL